MTSEPKAPGAAAIYLYRQFDRDDTERHEYLYNRIKIFTEEGRQFANVEIPFRKGESSVKNIQCRTIHPDGSLVNFDATIYERPIVKAKGIKLLAKVFTLPDVQPGSIIEYRFTLEGDTPDSSWILSESLFTKLARFSFHYSPRYSIQWSWPLGLPPGTQPPVDDHHVVRLETRDVPAFRPEPYMPPEHEMKYRVEFTYVRGFEKNPEKFWRQQDKSEYLVVEMFTDKRKAMERAVAETISPTDAPDIKLQKLYTRAQGIHNTSYERGKSRQEIKREKAPDIRTVEDVWKHNCGNRWTINWLFLALVRAAGFQADSVLISTRETHFFDRRLMNNQLLNSNLVVVKLNEHDVFLDPGDPFAPFGTLAWHETDVPGLRVNEDGGSWVTTPEPKATESRIERRAVLKLAEDGSLEGDATITFVGVEALWRRHSVYDDDDQTRKKLLEAQVKEYIPENSEAELTNKPDWNSAAPTLTAEFKIKIPMWASSAGRRTLFPVGLFGRTEKNIFDGTTRTYPIYFSFPYQTLDDVTVTLPAGIEPSSIPDTRAIDIKACAFDLKVEGTKRTIHMTRQLTVNLGSTGAKYYPALRTFYQHVQTYDEQPLILTPAEKTVQN